MAAWRLGALFLSAGGLALTVQATLLRDLMVSLQGDEAALALGLFAWLAGIAVGAPAARFVARKNPARWSAVGIGLLALAGPLGLVTARLGRAVVAPPAGELLPLGSAVLLALAVLVPPGFLVGWTFTALAAGGGGDRWTGGRRIAYLYVMEAAGSLAGGLLVTFVTVPFLPPFSGICLAAGMWLVLALPAAFRGELGGRAVLAALAAGLLVAALPPVASPVEDVTVRARFAATAPGFDLVAWDDTRYQHVAVAGDDPRHVYAGGHYSGTFPDPAEHEALAHRLACLAPGGGRILILGGPGPGLVRHLLRHPFEGVDLVFLDERAFRLVRSFLAPEDVAALDDPRVRVAIDDPRRILAREKNRYGLILLLEPEPVTLLLSRLATVEFYELCADRLAPEGTLVVRIGTGPNVLTGETAVLAGSIFGALDDVFPVLRAGPGPDTLLVAGRDDATVSLDPRVLARRFDEREIESEVFVSRLFLILFPPARTRDQQDALVAVSETVPASRDAHPVSFLYALTLRQRFTGGGIAPILRAVSESSPVRIAAPVLLPAVLVLFFVILRRGSAAARNAAAVAAVAATGACGMTWSLLVLFSYQTRAGALYGRLGLLAALFMAGLAAGGWAMARAAESDSVSARARLTGAVGGALAFAVVVVLTLGTMGGTGGATSAGLLHAALLVVAGAVTGSVFPAATGVLLAERHTVAGTAAALESADHAGAAVAAMIAGVILVPALGLTGAAWLLVALEGVAVTTLLVAPLRTGC